MKRIFSIVNPSNGKEKRVTESQLEKKISEFKPKFSSPYPTKKKALDWAALRTNKTKDLITRGYKHAGIYDVWTK